MPRPSSPTASTTRPRASAPACWRERETSGTPAFPGLWKLRDTNGDGRADERKLLHDGYGVHVGFLGHDLHGLRFGPDGRLYFSIGDRGFNVTTFDGKTLAVPDTGSVLRCEPDGTDLEVFATGLRNPQELAFDQYGNLFTGDNNSDSGDRARWVYRRRRRRQRLANRLPVPRSAVLARAVERREALVPRVRRSGGLHRAADRQPRRRPVRARLRSGREHASRSSTRTISSWSISAARAARAGSAASRLEPQGASFKLVDSKQFVWSVLATDVDFGPDGALYFCDWVEGWNKPQKGRIYRLLDESRRGDPAVREVKDLLAQGMERRGLDELARLLAHADMRVRQEAQFELAARGGPAGRRSRTVASSKAGTLARIHAVWGLGQAARSTRARSGDHNQRAGALAAACGRRPRGARPDRQGAGRSQRPKQRSPVSSSLLTDPSPRVQFFAAIALGKLGRPQAVEPLLAMLRSSGDKDPYLRHAGVMGLAGVGQDRGVDEAIHDESPAVRMGVLLALRRLRDPEIARFLDDPDPRLVLEAARAIHDVPIEPAMPGSGVAAGPRECAASAPAARS